MMAIFQNKIVMLVLGGVLIAGVVWYSFLRDRGDGSLIQTTDLTQATPVDTDIVNTLLQLRAVTLTGTIFKDPAFLQLKDFGSQIREEPVGRPNPFAPLSGVAASAGSSSGGASTSTASTTRR